MNIKKILAGSVMFSALLIIMTPVSVNAVSEELTRVPEGQEEDFREIELLRERMGLPPILEFNNSMLSGVRCHALYLSANSDELEDSCPTRQETSLRKFNSGCYCDYERFIREYDSSSGFHFPLNHFDDFMDTFFCRQDSMSDSVKSLVNHPYRRLWLFQPFTDYLTWGSAQFRKNDPAYGFAMRILSPHSYKKITRKDMFAGTKRNHLLSSNSLAMRSWEEKSGGYCRGSELEDPLDCQQNIHEKHLSSFNKLVGNLRILSSSRARGAEFPDKYYECTNSLTMTGICQPLIDLINDQYGGDSDDAYFELKNELVDSVTKINEVLAHGHGVIAYPFASKNFDYRFDAALYGEVRQHLPLPAFAVQAVPITVQLLGSIPQGDIHEFALEDEHHNNFPVVADRTGPGNAWVFYPLRRFDWATKYYITLGYHSDEWDEAPQQLSWSFMTSAGESGASVYRLGDLSWDDAAYSKLSRFKKLQQTYYLPEPQAGDKLIVNVRPSVAEEILISRPDIQCQGWKVEQVDDGTLAITAGATSCSLLLIGKTLPIKERMKTLIPDWLDATAGSGLADDPRLKVTYLNKEKVAKDSFKKLGQENKAELRSIELKFSNQSSGCHNTFDKVFDCLSEE